MVNVLAAIEYTHFAFAFAVNFAVKVRYNHIYTLLFFKSVKASSNN